MTIVFQICAVIAIVFAGVFLFRGGGARNQALRRVLMFLFILAAASSVFFPQAWTWVANLFGIGRGADLLLYLLVLIFIGFVANTYRRFRQLETSLTTVARELALLKNHYSDNETSSTS
jgi:hypothetical protein